MRIKMKMAVSLLLLTFCVYGRDPFFLQERRCSPPASDGPGWQLLGVIGRSGDYQAWLRSPQGHTLHGKPGDVLPGTPWQLTVTGWLSASLSSSVDCQPMIRLTLKGQQYAPDALSLAGVDLPAVSGTSAAFTGLR